MRWPRYSLYPMSLIRAVDIANEESYRIRSEEQTERTHDYLVFHRDTFTGHTSEGGRYTSVDMANRRVLMWFEDMYEELLTAAEEMWVRVIVDGEEMMHLVGEEMMRDPYTVGSWNDVGYECFGWEIGGYGQLSIVWVDRRGELGIFVMRVRRV